MVGTFLPFQTSEWQVRRLADVMLNGSDEMVDRHWFGDLSLAILLALPLAALAFTQPVPKQKMDPARAFAAVPLHSDGRISLLA